MSSSYLNSQTNTVAGSNYLVLQTGNGGTVSIPTLVGNHAINKDVLYLTTGIRYGLTKDIELNFKISAVATEQRYKTVNTKIGKITDKRFSGATIGINYRFRNNADRAGILGFASIKLAQNSIDNDIEYGKSITFGVNSFQTYDPVVLSFKLGSQLNAHYQVNNQKYQPGHRLFISSSIGFAVNNKVTLTTGFNWSLAQAAKINNKAIDINRTTTSLNFGVGYGLTKNDTLNLSIRPQVSGNASVQLNLSWSHRIG